ncbi:Myc-type, basic helix-loop-helix (bHLH) domain [Dillenia turbinata]|uniref:Myc-type, basic helix-loop-helix (BHLH) domain n=1 Tax=Dillenia turbinata TaxID=194707 RepID=A0AAN8VAG7_9MAGN
MNNSFEDSNWDFLDYNLLIGQTATPADFDWLNDSHGKEIVVAPSTVAALEVKECAQSECKKKRGRDASSSSQVNKACREKLRREKLNDMFLELSSALEIERPAKFDKVSILSDAIGVVNQLKMEAQELKNSKKRLLQEIKCLKAEKNELREEKLALKANKDKVEQQLKVMSGPPGFLPAHPAAYHAGPNKMPVFPGYSVVPMWQYFPPSGVDTSRDHELRPPAA